MSTLQLPHDRQTLFQSCESSRPDYSPPTSTVYSSPLHPEHAVSAIYDPTTSTCARVLHNGYVLELRHLAYSVRAGDKGKGRDPDAHGAPIIRIFFPDPLRALTDTCIISVRQTTSSSYSCRKKTLFTRLRFPFEG